MNSNAREILGADPQMPVTPFHLGPALLAKSAIPRWFSLLAFTASQCLIDVETMYNISTGTYPYHAIAHTIHVGGLIGACAGVATALVGRLIRRNGGEDQFIGMAHEFAAIPCLIGGIVGGTSHAVLDAIMHPDAGPFRPFNSSNPFLGVISVWTLHLLCLLCGVIGIYLVKTVDGEVLAERLLLASPKKRSKSRKPPTQ